MTDIISHLKSRGIDPSRTTVVVDEESGTSTFLLFNLSGQLAGYQRYNPQGEKSSRDRALMRYVTHTADEGGTKKIAVWGLDTLEMHPTILFVTEGIFDAAKVHNAGLPCIAVLTNNPKQLRPWLKALGKYIVVIKDNDEAGQKLGSLGDTAITVPDGFKDLGDMPQELADEFLNDVVVGLAGEGL